jgi:hypothetical protein
MRNGIRENLVEFLLPAGDASSDPFAVDRDRPRRDDAEPNGVGASGR